MYRWKKFELEIDDDDDDARGLTGVRSGNEHGSPERRPADDRTGLDSWRSIQRATGRRYTYEGGQREKESVTKMGIILNGVNESE